MLTDLWQDIRYGARVLTKNPGFTSVAVLTLALGIGANAAIFSVINGILLRPLPYKESHRLVLMRISLKDQTFLPSFSHADLLDFRERAQLFEQFETVRAISMTLTGRGDPEHLSAARVSPDFFQMLGYRPILGRSFETSDAAPNDQVSVILDHGLWQRRFGGLPDVLGQTVTLNGLSAIVVGVLPEYFKFDLAPDTGLNKPMDLWVPAAIDPSNRFGHTVRSSRLLARLKPGVTHEQAQGEMDSIAEHLKAERPDYRTNEFRVHVVPLHEDVVRSVRPLLLILFVSIGLVLLITSANVANLFLVRAVSRRKEMAIRSALSATRARMVRQVLTESGLVALLGGGVGFLLANWGVKVLVLASPADFPRLGNVKVDGATFLFTAGVSLLTALFVGLVPAFQGSKAELVSLLNQDPRAQGSTVRKRFRRLLIVAEVALSLPLLVGAGLMLQSFRQLLQVEPGFRPENVLTFRLTLPSSRYRTPERTFAFSQQFLERVFALPGVQGVGSVFQLPLEGGFWTANYAIDEESEQSWGTRAADQNVISPGYLEAMGTRLIAGRLFTWQDNIQERKVVIVDEKMARLAWPGENSIGKRILVELRQSPEWMEVIGVVEHTRRKELSQESREQIYLLPTHFWLRSMSVAIRSSINSSALLASVGAELQELDKDLPLYNVHRMEDYVSAALASQRYAMLLMLAFSGTALVLTIIGLYGVISYAVSHRVNEIGIRMALGARPGDIFNLIVGEGLLLALIGVALGIGGAFTGMPYLETMLFSVAATDPMTMTGATVVFLGVALLACYFPARRAVKVDPMVALRYE